jgi:hypothetical protein
MAQGNHGVLGVPKLSSSLSLVHVPSLWEVGVLQITMLLMFPPALLRFCLIFWHGACRATMEYWVCRGLAAALCLFTSLACERSVSCRSLCF